MSSVPPLFGDFGKSTRDLFKKKYDFDQRYKSVRKASQGVTVEAGAVVDKDGILRGYLKDTWAHASFTLDGEVSTDSNGTNKASLKSTKLAKGVTVEGKVNTKSDDKELTGTVYSGEVQYSRENFAGSAELSSDRSTHKLKASASVGFDGMNVGGSATVNLSKGGELSDYNVGLEYSRTTHTVSLVADNKLDWLNLSYFHLPDKTQSLGAQFKVELGGKRQHSLTVGHELAIDAKSNFKAKVEIPSGQVTVALEHKLEKPSVVVSFAGAFTPATFGKGVRADKFGLGITAGDY